MLDEVVAQKLALPRSRDQCHTIRHLSQALLWCRRSLPTTAPHLLCRLQCSQHSIVVHKVLVAAHSSFLRRRLLLGGLLDNLRTESTLQLDCSSTALQALEDFFYSTDLVLPTEEDVLCDLQTISKVPRLLIGQQLLLPRLAEQVRLQEHLLQLLEKCQVNFNARVALAVQFDGGKEGTQVTSLLVGWVAP